MNKIKVLQFSIGNIKGGITQYVLQNWKFIDKTQFQFDFATMSEKLDFADELSRKGCKVHYISCYAENNEKQFIQEINQILDENYDVIHIHTCYWKGFLVEKLASQRGIPKIIVHAHNTMIDISDENKRMEALRTHESLKKEFPIEYATDFCACTLAAAQWLFGTQIPQNRIRLLKNAIDISSFSYSEGIRKKCRKELGLEKCFVLGNIGRFEYLKNHVFLIQVFYLVSKLIPQAKLILVGTGSLEKGIFEMACNLGIVEKVLFLGKRNDVNELMQAMDLFLLPSLFEGLGIVLIEAQASGLKCLTSENVPQDAKITDNIDYLSLEVKCWVQKIISLSGGYCRDSMDKAISEAGYNIRIQIKELENYYRVM